MKKRNLFDENGRIQISKFDPEFVIKLDADRVREIGDHNERLEDAEFITQEVLQLEFSV